MDTSLTDYELARAEAISVYEAQLATASLGVRRFRDRHLGGRLLTPDEAVAFVQSADLRAREALRLAVTSLVRRFKWGPKIARQFLLSGGVVFRHPIRGSWDKDGRIVLAVDPWVPAETVAQVYREQQREKLGQVSHAISLGKIALFRFVLEHSEGFARPSWRELRDGWNQAYPDWAYTDPKRMGRDFRRAMHALLPVP